MVQNTDKITEDMTVQTLDGYLSVKALTNAIVAIWPDHKKFIDSSLKDTEPCALKRLDEVAALALTLAGNNLEKWAEDYRWLCERFREEQFYFARHKKYRLSSLQEATQQVYNNDVYMSRYMNGLLFSQIFWKNHAQSMDIFRTKFLPGNKDGYDYLEVGPGHGLFMAFVSQDERCASLTGYDLSPSSLEDTKEALLKMKIKREVNLLEQDIVKAEELTEQFDSIVCSEVLEHTEEPERALVNMHDALRQGGRLFLHVPINSPAPDHIYLWRKPEEIEDMVKRNGFEVEFFAALPPTGKTLEEAKKYNLDVSCIAIARKS